MVPPVHWKPGKKVLWFFIKFHLLFLENTLAALLVFLIVTIDAKFSLIIFILENYKLTSLCQYNLFFQIWKSGYQWTKCSLSPHGPSVICKREEGRESGGMEGLIIYINKNQVIYSSSSPYLISTFLVSELLTVRPPTSTWWIFLM